MPLVTNVFRRGGSYYFRTRVPARFGALLERKELWRSLRTKDPREARQRASVAVLLTDRLMHDLERIMSSPSSNLSRDHIRALVDQWLKAELDLDADLRRRTEQDREGDWHAGVILERTPPGEPELVVEVLDEAALSALVNGQRSEILPPQYLLTDVNEVHLQRGQRHKIYEDSVARHRVGDTSIATRHVRELFKQHDIRVDDDSDVFDIATRLMTKAHRDLLKSIDKRDMRFWRPDLDDDPADHLLAGLAPSQPVQSIGSAQRPASTNTTVTQAIALHNAEALKGVGFSKGRAGEYVKAGQLFTGWLERDPDVSEITPAMAGGFREMLMRYPANASVRAAYRDLSVNDRLAKAIADNDPGTLSVTTANGNYLDPLRSAFDWAKSTGRIRINPFEGITVSKTKVKAAVRKRSDFTLEQLNTLFSAPLFTGAAGDEGAKLYQPGPVRVADWRYWLPLMAMHSGARLNELCGLRVIDFDNRDGIPFFHVRALADHQSIKTAASERIVPIHHSLLDLGLLDHVERMRAAEEDRLFPTLRPGPRGHLSHTPSKFFGRLIDRMLPPDAAVVFHSFRHTFITKMREASVPREVRTALVGHEDDSTHEGYGAEPLTRLDAGVQAVVWQSLDLSHIRLSLNGR